VVGGKALEPVERVAFGPPRDGAGETEPTPKSLDHQEAFKHFDALEDARSDLDSTLAIMSRLVDAGCQFDVVVTLDRHLKSDLAALNVACDGAREAILSPLNAAAPPRETLNERAARNPARLCAEI
jgi:hypothetical protein